MDARQSLQTRERAAMTAWAVYQRNVRQLSLAAICALAASEAIRSETDGSYSTDGGLSRPLAISTLYGWLTEARDQFRDEYIKRPILDMIMEEDERLEHLASIHMTDARNADIGTDKRAKALDSYLRTLESRRKLLGLDRPQQIEVTHEVAQHDDPASTKLKKAMEAAQARRDEMLAEVNDEGDSE
jgi:hypothetical protein